MKRTFTMKMTTTLLATLLFASTGAIADTTTLTEQDKLLMDRAAMLQMSTWALLRLDESIN